MLNPPGGEKDQHDKLVSAGSLLYETIVEHTGWGAGI